MDNEEKIKEILEENAKLKEELQATKEHLKKYTAPASRKEYYKNNKDIINERNRKYKENTNYKPIKINQRQNLHIIGKENSTFSDVGQYTDTDYSLLFFSILFTPLAWRCRCLFNGAQSTSYYL